MSAAAARVSRKARKTGTESPVPPKDSRRSLADWRRASVPFALSPDTRKLRDLAGIGKSIEANLRLLGVTSVPNLAACDGDELYEQLCRKTSMRQDPCVLDTFRCAVAQARNPQLPVEQRNWWWWSRQRKLGKLEPRNLGRG